MHQDPADNVLFLRPTLEALVQNAQRLSRLALIGELCCVVQDQDRAVGRSHAVKTEQREVMVEWGPQPKKVTEEVVTELQGQIELPAGRQELILVQQNVIDGKLEKVSVAQ